MNAPAVSMGATFAHQLQRSEFGRGAALPPTIQSRAAAPFQRSLIIADCGENLASLTRGSHITQASGLSSNEAYTHDLSSD